MRYIAYGSNLDVEQMKWRCPNARFVRVSKLANFRLRFRRGFLTIEPAEGSEVPVVIWEIDDSDMDSLDRYEGHAYYKIVLPGGFAYVMYTKYPLGKPTSMYLKTVVNGYDYFGFDLDILQEAYDEVSEM